MLYRCFFRPWKETENWWADDCRTVVRVGVEVGSTFVEVEKNADVRSVYAPPWGMKNPRTPAGKSDGAHGEVIVITIDGWSVGQRISLMASTRRRKSSGKTSPMLPMRNVSAWEILPG